MKISCKPLWKTLIDKNMGKKDLRLRAHLTTNHIANTGKGEHISIVGSCHTPIQYRTRDRKQRSGSTVIFGATIVSLVCGRYLRIAVSDPTA